MSGLVLAIFPGIDVLGLGFERAGWCVVRGPDVIFGGDIREFHPPAGVFDGVIGGDPCQSHSALANLVRANGLEPSFPDMTPEYERIVNEARPRWFLRENVPKAPDVKPAGYDVRSFLLDHSTLDSGDGTGHEQMRKRRFWFGVRQWGHQFTTGVYLGPDSRYTSRCLDCGEEWPCKKTPGPGAPELRQWIDFALYVLPDRAVAVGNGHDYIDGAEPIERYRTQRQCDCGHSESDHDGGDCLKCSCCDERYARQRTHAVDGSSGEYASYGRDKKRTASDTGRHPGEIGATGGHKGNAPRYSLAEMLELQGLPPKFLDHAPWTMQGKRKAVGNAVPLGMACALGRAVREAMK
jgi:site-specific DNA-cytosine methylase